MGDTDLNPISHLLVLLAALLAAGCGVETATTAATAVALKQKELEAARKTIGEAEKKIGESIEQLQQGAQKAADADK